jgi:hypothetical protein
MFSRVLAAAFAAALGAGLLAAPFESAAKGGGVSFGRIGAFHPPIPPIHRSFVRRPPPAHATVVRVHAFRTAPRHDRAVDSIYAPGVPLTYGTYASGLPLTYGDNGPFYGSYYDPSDTGSLYQPPLADPSALVASVGEPGAQLTFAHGGCRAQSVTVPSLAGGERTVTITRC